ncbi:MAG: CHAT domain-containing tetratricopeptide repeat protein [Gemmataceae bacterium]
MRTTAFGLLLLIIAPAIADEPKPPELTPEEQKLAAASRKLNQEGVQLFHRGTAAEAAAKIRQALEIRRKLYPASKYPAGHPDLADSLNNMGYMLQALGYAESALPFCKQALAMYRTLYPVTKYPNGQRDLAAGLSNVGYALLAVGSADKALPFYEQSLAMFRSLYPPSKYPDGDADLATGLDNMFLVLQAIGSYEKALQFCEQALAMRRNLYPASRYPDGHPELAGSLHNMGFLLKAMRSGQKALPYYEQALAMRRALYPTSKYPRGHPSLARSLGNMGTLLESLGSAEAALPYYEQALAMNRSCYPQSTYPGGHPTVAGSLNNMGFLLGAMGSNEKALAHFAEALAMYRTLYPASRYPDGHPDLALGLRNMGSMLHAMGSAEKALPFYEEALAIDGALGRGLLLTASEADALANVQSRSPRLDAYLSTALGVAGTDPAAYRAVWDSKALVTRVLEVRYATARAADTAAADTLARLRETRRRIDRVLQDSHAADRDRELVRLSDARDALERRLAADLPILAQRAERDRLSPADLGRELPANATFIDVLGYIRFEQDPAVNGKAGEKQVPSYAAFVVNPGQSAARVELGPAAPIHAAVRRWRLAIEQHRPDGDAAAAVSRLVWSKLAPHVPGGTKTLFLALDRDLARVPWAALPVGRRVLLEDYALATVPHGPFLLEALKYARTFRGRESLLALGDVEYGPNWAALPGTKMEVAAVAALAPGDRETASGTGATAAKLAELLPRARFAHLATHGEFKADEFAAERKRELDARRSWREGTGDSRRAGAKNPLAYVGLVLAGGEVLSGLTIPDLNLENLQLVTLSACETGLGELTGGKGVENLQMAFHLAGCPNVVASLWKVNDAATAALMAKFYHELWVNKKPPIEALREAQLAVYRGGAEVIAALQDRGRPDFKRVITQPAAELQPAAGVKRADTKLWAAFVLSGVGR